MDTLTIGLYSDSYVPVVDGVATCVRNYAYWLTKEHCSAYVAVPNVRDYVDDDPFPVVRFASIPLVGHAPYRLGIPAVDMEFREREIGYLPDLVHAHSPFFSGRAAMRLARKLDIPLIATFHSKFYDDFKQATNSELIAKKAVDYVVGFFNQADSVWTVNRGTERTLREYGFEGEVRLIGNGTDFTGIEDRQGACREVEERFGLAPEDRLMLFVGQQIFQKNLAKLLDAAALYRKNGGKFRMLMVGEGYAKSQLEKQAQELGLSDCVTFTGKILDRELLSKLYVRAQLFTFPSIYDNAPVVLREAAAMGCPAILVEGSNAADGVEEGENAFLCEDSSESIAAAMERALSDEALRQKVGEGARRTLARTWKEVMDEVYGVYLEEIENYKSRKALHPKKGSGTIK